MLNIQSCQDEAIPPESSGDDASKGETGSGSNAGEGTAGDDSGTPTEPADTDKPVVAVTATPTLAGGVVGGTTAKVTIDMRIHDAHLQKYTLSINGVTAKEVTAFDDPSAEINAQYVWDVTTPNKVDSSVYVVTLTATDQAGNSESASQNVEVDNTAPVVTVDGGKLIKNGSITPTVTATDMHGVASYAWVANSTNPAKLSFDATDPEPTFTPTVQGSYSFSLAVSDPLGNVSVQRFEFDYAPMLATIPLPTETDPTQTLTTKKAQTTTPAVRQTSNNVRTNETPDEAVSKKDAVNTASVVGPVSSGSVIVPTNSGWQVLGILWYWWLAVAAVVGVVWLMIRWVLFKPLIQESS